MRFIIWNGLGSLTDSIGMQDTYVACFNGSTNNPARRLKSFIVKPGDWVIIDNNTKDGGCKYQAFNNFNYLEKLKII